MLVEQLYLVPRSRPLPVAREVKNEVPRPHLTQLYPACGNESAPASVFWNVTRDRDDFAIVDLESTQHGQRSRRHDQQGVGGQPEVVRGRLTGYLKPPNGGRLPARLEYPHLFVNRHFDI